MPPFSFFMYKVQAETIDRRMEMMKRIEIMFLFAPFEAMAPMCAKVFQVMPVRAVCPMAVLYFVRPAGTAQTLSKVVNDKGRNGDSKWLDIHGGSLRNGRKNRTTDGQADPHH